MNQDPRSQNQFFEVTDISRYIKEYASLVFYSLYKIDAKEIDAAKDALHFSRTKGGRIFVAGNGGSSAIADHLVCDLVKGTHIDGKDSLKVQSLNGSTALFTAIGNDFGYEHTFEFQLKTFDITSKDVVILISSSGNSQNIIRAANYAREKRCTVIAMTGFSGGELNKMHDIIKLHIPANNYGIVEDCHQALMHILAQWHYLTKRAEL